MVARIDIDEQLLVQLYTAGEGCVLLSRRWNCSPVTIENRLHSLGIKLRSTRDRSCNCYPINDKYFDIIDTPDKAYILGLLFADGNSSNKGYSVSLQLQERDRHILEEIRNILYPDKQRQPEIFPAIWRGRTYPKLTISSKKVTSQLYFLGLIPNKTGIIEFPSWLSANLTSSFIRGYFDGDGTVGICNTKIGKKPFVSISGNQRMISNLRLVLRDKFGISVGVVVNTCNSAKINIGSIYSMLQFEDVLYTNANLYLYRKMLKFKEIRDMFGNSKFAKQKRGGPAPGVYWDKNRSLWLVYIGRKYIGRFSDVQDALNAAKAAKG